MSDLAAGPLTLDQVLALLRAGQVTLEGRLPWSSNATFLTRVEVGDQAALAVYKPCRGERPLWDFPAGTLCRRETAAFVVSQALGWQLVPPTVLREGPYGPGMVQLFIAHDPEQHYLALAAPDAATIRCLAAFDVVINNADRKSGHVLLAEDGVLWAIDHGVCFHVQPKLRTVIWEHAGEALTGDVVEDLRALADALDEADGPVHQELISLLTTDEVAATADRARRLARAGRLPAAELDWRNVPWPPV